MERGGIGAGKNLKSSGAVPKAETVPSANARANLSTSGSDMTEQSNKTARKGNAKVGSDEDVAVKAGHPNPALRKAYQGCGLATSWMPSPGVTRPGVFPIILVDHATATPAMLKGLKSMVVNNKNNQVVVFISASKRSGPTRAIDYFETFGVVPKDAIIPWTPANEEKIMNTCRDAETNVASTEKQDRPLAAMERLKEIEKVYGPKTPAK